MKDFMSECHRAACTVGAKALLPVKVVALLPDEANLSLCCTCLRTTMHDGCKRTAAKTMHAWL